MITLSGHHPFEQKEEDCRLKLKDPVKGTIVGDLSVNSADNEALEGF